MTVTQMILKSGGIQRITNWKDILTTHAVWPTMLMSAEIELPRSIFAHGWWLMGESK